MQNEECRVVKGSVTAGAFDDGDKDADEFVGFLAKIIEPLGRDEFGVGNVAERSSWNPRCWASLV